MDLPEPSDTLVYESYIANRKSAVLALATHLGLFEFLAAKPATTDDICAKFQLSKRGAEAWLLSLQSLQLISRNAEGVFTLTAYSDLYLVPGKKFYLGGLIEMEYEHFITPKNLLDSMRSGECRVYEEKDVWKEHEVDAEKAKKFTLSMQSISARPAIALSRTFDFSDRKVLLDVGGGSGVYVVEALKTYPHLRGIVFDIAPVCEVAKSFIDSAGVSDRGSTHAGDMFKDVFPSADSVLFSQILHDWPYSKGVDLLRKAHAILPDRGVVLVHEKLIRDEDLGPPEVAMVTIDMLFWTEGQQYTRHMAVSAVREAGFRDIAVIPTTGYWSVVVGHK